MVSDDGIAYKSALTRKGRPKLVGGGYGYARHRQSGGSVQWRCVEVWKTKCPARLNMRHQQLFSVKKHNHPPYTSYPYFSYYD